MFNAKVPVNTSMEKIMIHWSEWPSISKKSTNSKWWRGYGDKETLCAIGGNVNWYNHYGGQYKGALKN